MYPELRSIVRRLANRSFAIVSVDTDNDKATLEKSTQSGEITWRCWWDGGKEGPITTRWGVYRFPSVFVIDSRGVIRFLDVETAELLKTVELLLAENPLDRAKP